MGTARATTKGSNKKGKSAPAKKSPPPTPNIPARGSAVRVKPAAEKPAANGAAAKTSTPAAPAAAPAKTKRVYVRVSDLTPKEREAFKAKLTAQRWSSARTISKYLARQRTRLQRPNWEKLGVDTAPLLAWFDATDALLKIRAANSTGGGARWPMPKVGDTMNVRAKYHAVYLDEALKIDADSLTEMMVEAVSPKRVVCMVETAERMMSIPFRPRHLELWRDPKATPEEEVAGPSVDDDAGVPVGEEPDEDDDELEGEDDGDEEFADEDEDEDEEEVA